MNNRRIRDFAIGSIGCIMGCGIGAIGTCKVLDMLVQRKHFTYGFRDLEKSNDDKIIFNMRYFEGDFILEYNKKNESDEYNKEKKNDEQTFHNTFID